MKITVHLQPETERDLIAQASAKGISLADYAREILEREAATRPETETETSRTAATAKDLYELFAPVRGLLTDEEIDTIFSRTPATSRPGDLE